MLALALMALAALPAPLKVRVLERDRPIEAWLEASALSCDGVNLKSVSVQLTLKDGRLAAGAQPCDSVTAEGGEVKVALSNKSRHYRGKLTATVEGVAIRFINEVDVDEYLPGVVVAEAGDFPPEALEAQAVVSRTFALASRRRHEQAGYELCDLAHCQVYRGSDEVPAPVDTAVKRTRGEVLLLGGVGLKPAYFHAACGGRTSRPFDVFGEEGSGPGVSDVVKDGPLCKDAPNFAWTFDVERADLIKALGGAQDAVAFEALRRDASGRVLELKALGKRMRGGEFVSAMGRAFGWQSIRSMKVTAVEKESTIHFSGTGIGHGVGLCQEGAKAMAGKGATYKQILQKYFPDCQVRAP